MLKFIAFAALIATTAAASAEPLAADVVITITASDRADQAGKERLMRKVSLAAEQLCGSIATVESFQWDEISRCRGEAFRSVDRQLARMNQPGTIRLAAR